MGFSIPGRGRFLGSGHPDPRDAGKPPNLGLIESRDGGRSWEQVSLLGEADFHVLRSSGDRVYGFNATGGELRVSDDGGERWRQRTPPGPLIDLAIDPRDRDRAIAVAEDGLHESRDAGATWRPLQRASVGLLAWPSRGRLYLVDGGGMARLSRDGGRTWESRGSIGGQPAAFAAHRDDLYAALADGTVLASADGGETWAVRSRP